MESIGYMLRRILTVLLESGIEIEEIRSMGGGARSDTWLQIKSDICNYPIVKMLEEEAPSLGAAVIASVKVGDYADVEDAVKSMVRTGRVFRPGPDTRNVYETGYELYCELYRSLKHLFQRYRVDMP
jgi:xylulokinase